MPDYSVDQELVQSGEGSLTFLEPRLGRERRVEAQGEMIHFPESCVPRLPPIADKWDNDNQARHNFAEARFIRRMANVKPKAVMREFDFLACNGLIFPVTIHYDRIADRPKGASPGLKCERIVCLAFA